jgi:hypothetical protein
MIYSNLIKLICLLYLGFSLHQSNFSQIFLLSRIEYIIKETILLVNVTFVGYNSCVISTRSSPFIRNVGYHMNWPECDEWKAWKRDQS